MRGCRVSDVEKCADWYCRVFGLTRLPVTAPHHGDEDGGYAVLLADPRTRMLIDLHHHPDLREGRFDERRTGMSLSGLVAGRGDLLAQAAWLVELGSPGRHAEGLDGALLEAHGDAGAGPLLGGEVIHHPDCLDAADLPVRGAVDRGVESSWVQRLVAV